MSYRIEGIYAGQWSEESVSDQHHEFDSLSDAMRALEMLLALGWPSNELRIVPITDAAS
jgi:hypothetical protein